MAQHDEPNILRYKCWDLTPPPPPPPLFNQWLVCGSWWDWSSPPPPICMLRMVRILCGFRGWHCTEAIPPPRRQTPAKSHSPSAWFPKGKQAFPLTYHQNAQIVMGDLKCAAFGVCFGSPTPQPRFPSGKPKIVGQGIGARTTPEPPPPPREPRHTHDALTGTLHAPFPPRQDVWADTGAQHQFWACPMFHCNHQKRHLCRLDGSCYRPRCAAVGQPIRSCRMLWIRAMTLQGCMPLQESPPKGEVRSITVPVGSRTAATPVSARVLLSQLPTTSGMLSSGKKDIC